MRFTLVGLIVAATAADWPSFRGPNASGLTQGAAPLEIGPSKNVAWRIELPPGNSSPVLTTDSIFLTGYTDKDLLTLKIDRATGRIAWRRAVSAQRHDERHKLNNAASPTPVTDGRNVYSFFAEFGLVSYGPDGNERWRLPLGPFINLHGMAASPILAGDRIILVCDQDSESFLMAVNKNTGKVEWRTVRPAVVHGFATATLFKDQIIVPGSYLLAAYSVKDGSELWSARGLSWQIKATAIVDNDTIYATGWAPGADPGQAKPIPSFDEAAKQADANKDGKLQNAELPEPWKHGGSWTAIDLDKDGGLDRREWGFYRARREANNVTMAVKPGNARGDITETHVVWKHQRMVPEVPSPLLFDGILYTVKTGGILTSMSAKSGEIYKTARVQGAIDGYYASPIAAGGRLFLFSEKGKAAVIKPGAQWETESVTDFDEPIYATPAVADGVMYLRTSAALYAFRDTKN